MPKRRASAKGLVPQLSERGIWQAVGTVGGKRVRKSLKTRDEATAAELCAAYEAKLWKRHSYGEEAVRTFEDAAVSYLEHGGPEGTGGEGRFLAPLIRHFKGRTLGTIKPAELRAAANTLYPGATPATRNRQGIAPARAVIMHGHDLGWCGAIKVKQFEVPKSRKHKPVDRAWLDAFLAEADRSKLPHLSALVLFMHYTATRVSEAIRLEGQWIDLNKRLVVLEETKEDEFETAALTAELVGRISALGPRPGVRIFGYTDPKAVNRVMKRVAIRAGIEPRTTHSAGRHSFGTNVMALPGAKVKDAMEAGRWKSAKLFMETYVHSTETASNIAAKFDAQHGPVDVLMAKSIKARRATFGKRK